MSDRVATSPPASKASGRILLLVAAAAVIASILVVLLLWPSDKARIAAEAERSARSRAQELDWAPQEQLVRPSEIAVPVAQGERAPDAAVAEIDPTAETVDLFAGPAPEIIERGHQFADSGRPLHSKRVKELYDFSKAHPGDARPQIVLALDSMNRGWYGFAAGHYKKAFEEDPRAAKDPRVLRDLLKIAGRRHDSDRAREALAAIYGRDALVPAQRAMAEASERGEEATAERLGELVTALEGQPERP
jgi:hypothetical protein